MTQHHMTCCCCGGYAGRWEQHWNRDTEYGICAGCVAEEMGRPIDGQRIEELYGKPGVNFEQPTVLHFGRRFRVLATFHETAAGIEAANAFMQRVKGAALLTILHGTIYLADNDDHGEPA